jgi:hypothetical protein
MEIEAFLLCDAATDSAGKLNVLGTFDTINAAAAPVVHPHCALALRLRFSRIEEGQHRVRINITDADGHLVIPGMEGNLAMRFGPEDQTAVTNLVLHIDRLKFDKPGQYSVDLAIDGRQERSLPLFVRVREKPPAAPEA